MYCELNKTYYAKKQAIGHIVRIEKGNIAKAKKDMDSQMDFNTFVTTYPSATIEKNVLIIRSAYKNYEDKQVVDFDKVVLNGNYGFGLYFSENLTQYDTVKAQTWLYNYDKEDATINAIYFTTDMNAPALTEKYARMVGYADCLIDTTSTKFKKEATRRYYNTRLPDNWQNLPMKEKENLLDTLRSVKVVGSCSMDTSPRFHSVNIALLSAETLHWEVFLRSHLDIMNDRFDRASDGSYAQASRQTYIKELETLNINTYDLIFGISLRIENPAENHYYGTIFRIGRALAESKYKDQIEHQLASMMKDPTLDDYNRVIAFYLYRNYIYYLSDETQKEKSTVAFKNAVATLPNYIHEKIEFTNQE